METEKRMQPFDAKTAAFLFIPLVCNMLTLGFLNHITHFWGMVLENYLPKLGYQGSLIYSKYSLFQTHFFLPAVNIDASLSSAMMWGATAFMTIALFLFTYMIKGSYTYFLRTFLILVWVTQIYTMFFPDGFVYHLLFYSKSGFIQILSLLFMIPWIFFISYVLFGYRFINNIVFTLLTLFYFIILAPFQYLVNVSLINLFSVMIMPPLVYFSCLMINILAIVALCTYGLSNGPEHAKFNKG